MKGVLSFIWISKQEGGVTMFNYSKLLGRMKEKGYTQGALAQALNISANSFTNKLHGKSSFSNTEIKIICDVLEISNIQVGSYFFTV